jgi:hypothetical protein
MNVSFIILFGLCGGDECRITALPTLPQYGEDTYFSRLALAVSESLVPLNRYLP